MVRATERSVREALTRVMDPEIPTCSIVDLGLVERLAVTEGAIEVDLLPTFAGCPALDAIRCDVEAALRALDPERTVRVRFVTSAVWTTDRISDAGRQALGAFGIAPPARSPVRPAMRPAASRCPYCGSNDTEEQTRFGPTPCRAIGYCRVCRNPFEVFKPKVRP